MYNSILDSLTNLNQINNIELYLQNLQQNVINLRRSYYASRVRVDYSNPKTQAAYLLAYYPQYTEMTYKVLCDLTQNYLHSYFVDCTELQACFFAAGPAPEAVGLVRHLNCNYPTVRYVVANTYDIAANTWSISQETTKYVVSQLFPNQQIILNGNSLDLCQKNAFSSIRDVIQTSHLFFIQNCLNEFVATPDIFIKNIEFLITEMPPTSILVIADLLYNSATNLLEKVEAYFSPNIRAKIIRSYTAGEFCLRSSLTPPPVITKNLLTGTDGLIPRININFNYLAIQKTPIVIEASYADLPF